QFGPARYRLRGRLRPCHLCRSWNGFHSDPGVRQVGEMICPLGRWGEVKVSCSSDRMVMVMERGDKEIGGQRSDQKAEISHADSSAVPSGLEEAAPPFR